MAKRGNPNWKKGVTGNPLGAPRKPEIEMVRLAIEETAVERKKTLWKHLIEQCYVDSQVLIAVAKKFMPDKIEDETFKNLCKTFLIFPKEPPKSD